MLTFPGSLKVFLAMDAAEWVAHILGPIAVLVGVVATVTRLAWDWIDRGEARAEKRSRPRRKPEPEAESP